MPVSTNRTMRNRNIPAGLPSDWLSAWNYTFTRSGGQRRRDLILELIKKNIIREFDSSMVLSGDLEDWMEIYYNAKNGNPSAMLNDEARKVRVALNTNYSSSGVEFKHTEETTKLVLKQLPYIGVSRLGENLCVYFWN